MSGKILSLGIVSLIAGILIGRLPFINEWYSIIPTIIAIGAFLISSYLSKRNPFHNINWINNFIAISLFFGIGLFSSSVSKPANIDFSKGEYAFSGLVKDYTPTSYGDKLLIELKELNLIENSTSYPIDIKNINALITIKDATNINYGNTISGYGNLQPVEWPSNYRNDDYIRYLKLKGICLTGFTDASKCVFINSHHSFNSFFLSLRDNLEAKIESTPLSHDTKSFMISILLGDKSYINKTERITFTDAGIAHIFAVSGLHVSLISMIFLTILSFFFFGRTRIWKFIIILPIVWFYIFLVGFSPSTCRAGIMLTLAFSAVALQRKHSAMKALGWSIILILSFMPNALFDIGLQLSVLCVGSLILIAEPLNFINHRAHPKLFPIVSIVLVTLVSTFSSWLICAFYFHRFSLMFLPLNLIIIPILPFFISISLLYFILYYCSLDLHFLGNFIDYLYSIFSKGVSIITSLSTPFENLHPHYVSVICWIIGLIILSYVLKQSKTRLVRLWLPTLFFIIAITTLFIIPVNLPNGFIIQKATKTQSVMIYNNDFEYEFVLPHGNIVSTKINGKRLIAVRTSDLSQYAYQNIKDADYILICKGCKELPEQMESFISHNCLIVTHPSLHWRNERNIIESAKEKRMNLHSLRYDGPLHVFED